MKATVVIPSFNHRPYVAEAIHSVLNQTCSGVELIVIDDGSRDGSRDHIAQLHQQHRGRFQFISRENRGLVATLQEALDLARGEYFCELASDDYLHPDNIAKRTRYLDRHPEVVAVFTDGLNVNKTGSRIGPITRDKIKALYRTENPIPAIINNVTPVFATGMMRTAALRACGGFDAATFRFYEDIDTPVRLASHGRFGYLDEQLFYRRIHDSNISSVTTHVRREKIFFYEKMLGDPGMKVYRTLLRNRMRRGAIALARTLNKAESIDDTDYQVLVRASACFPFDLRLHWYNFRVRQKYRQQMLIARPC